MSAEENGAGAPDPLAGLSQEASELEAGAGAEPGAPGAPLPAPVDTAQEWREAAAMGCGLIVAMYPELRAEWTQQTYDHLGDALDKCARRYGWELSELLSHPLLALAFATWPMATSLARVVKARAEAKAAKKQGADPGPARPAPVNLQKAAAGTIKIDGIAETPAFVGVSA